MTCVGFSATGFPKTAVISCLKLAAFFIRFLPAFRDPNRHKPGPGVLDRPVILQHSDARLGAGGSRKLAVGQKDGPAAVRKDRELGRDRKSTRLNSSHQK